MFFLLRCAFWLGLTFSMMDWPEGPSPAPDPRALAQSAADAAAQEIATRCAADPRACLESARKVEGLRKSLTETPRPQERAAGARNGG
jgi:hypothetical protein